ncbi:MAG: membrane protein insertase YidC [Oscillospiraceae bacterium]|nr:membrane protein insertase YidC [Oscillospiraceae bacterium]
MKKQHISRYLCLGLVLVMFLLVFTGCMGNTTQAANEDGTLKLVETAALSEEVKLGVFDYIKLPFSYLLRFLYDLTHSYGWALILFSIIVKIILFPTSAMSKKSMMKMSRLTPRVKALEEKYGDDKQSYQQAVSQLYKEEGAGGCGGCLWSLLPMLLLIPLYYIIREPITWLMFHGNVNARTVGEIQNVFINARNNAFLTDPNSALANLNATGFYWQMEALPFIDTVKSELAAISPAIEAMNTRFAGVELATVPNLMFWKYFDMHGVWNSIGQFLLPLLSGGVNMLSMWISQKMNSKVIVNEKGEQDAEMAKKSSMNNKAMTFMMPLFSVYIGFIAPAGLSLYWGIQAVTSTIQDIFLTKHYKKVYDAEDAIKQQKAAEEAAIEAERERQRAQRRAENPDGMVGSASKKKLQQREKNEQAAKEAAYLASQVTQEEHEAELEAQAAKLEGERPYRRGRNFDPNRYKNNKE